MIYTHEAAFLRIAEMRQQAAAERRAREFTERDRAGSRTSGRWGSRAGKRLRGKTEGRDGKPRQGRSTAA